MNRDVIDVPGIGAVVFHLRPIRGHQGRRVVREVIAAVTFEDGRELSAEQERAAKSYRADR